MKLPISWLKQYIDLKVSPGKLAEMLTMSGTAVERLERVGTDSVLEIEVTTNRPDCLSILGLGREISALTGKKLRLPAAYLPDAVPRGSIRDSKKRELMLPRGTASGKAVAVTVEDKKGCPRYTARLIEHVSVKPAPPEIRRFLESIGTRPISNVVDATNFVLFECGQPLHAFDYDKVKGGRIIVRRARSGEKFLGLDGAEYALDEKTLVIADAERPIAIAGVIGGKLTEVTDATKTVLLESATFDPALIRQASKRYKITTDSSYRFERSVNPANIRLASKRASDLIAAWALGQDVSGLVDKHYADKAKTTSLTLRTGRVEKLLGQKITTNKIAAILKKLSFRVMPMGKDNLRVMVDSSRRDIVQETDLIEEVLRIEGFEQIPSQVPVTRYHAKNRLGISSRSVFELKKFMAAIGFDEIVTYSLLSERTLALSGISSADCHRIVNAMSAEQALFRPSLLPGMLGTLLFNSCRKAEALKFFEIGKCYHSGTETLVLAFALYGFTKKNWRMSDPSTYYDAKGVLENIFDFWKISGFTWGDPLERSWAEEGGSVVLEGKTVGEVGRVSEKILKAWDIPQAVYFGQIRLEPLLSSRRRAEKIKPVPKYPLVRRDIAFVADRKIQVKEFEDFMRESVSGDLREISLFDEYVGKNIPSDKRSLAFSLAFQKETGTFTDEEIGSLEHRVRENLKSRYGVEFR